MRTDIPSPIFPRTNSAGCGPFRNWEGTTLDGKRISLEYSNRWFLKLEITAFVLTSQMTYELKTKIVFIGKSSNEEGRPGYERLKTLFGDLCGAQWNKYDWIKIVEGKKPSELIENENRLVRKFHGLA